MDWTRKVKPVNWFPEFGRAFVVCSLDNLASGARGGEYFIVKFSLNSEVSVFQQALYTFNLPTNLFSDDSLFNQMANGAEGNIHLEVDKLLLKAGRGGYAKETNPRFQTSSISEFIVAVLLSNQKGFLANLEDSSKSEALSKELNSFIHLKGIYAKVEK